MESTFNNDGLTAPLGPKIGKFQLQSPFVLAPMAGITDAPFRKICRDYQAGLSTSEMLTSDIHIWHQPKSQWRLQWASNETPVSIQIAGTDPGLMAQAAAQCQLLGADIIDINMGCPAKKVCKKFAGSALMAQEQLVYDIIRTVVQAIDCPVMVKTRTGSDLDSKNAVTIAQIAQAAGASAIAIHGRTRACKFKGTAEHSTVKLVKQAITIPVFANGDIKTAKEAKCILDETCVDGIMIGRGALGQPWIFQQLIDSLKQNSTSATLIMPCFTEVRTVIKQHLLAMYEFYGPYVGLRFARKHMGWYMQHIENALEFRNQFVRLTTTQAQLSLLDRFFDTLNDSSNSH